MSRYEARLEHDLERIRKKLTDLAEAVQTALETTSLALFAGDHEMAYEVCLADNPINRASRELDRICHGFIAVHLPSAGHLRFVSAVMHINIELERIGDYAKTISRESVQLPQPPTHAILGQLDQVSQEARKILERAITAFRDSDIEAAKAGVGDATEVGRRANAGFATIVEEEGTASARELLSHLVILNSFNRVADQAKNIFEETIFAVTGKTKAPKLYHVLFLDLDNALLGPMAQAIARRNHPQSGHYDTAGRQAAVAFEDGLGPFLAARGIDLGDASPQTRDPAIDLSDYHVLVALQGSVTDYIDTVPYSTIALDWHLEEHPPPAEADTTARFESLYRLLAPQLRDLMVTLHGEETP